MTDDRLYPPAAAFHLGDVLSITTGVLVSPSHMDGVYAILQHMVGEPPWTHQLPRVADECRLSLLEQHPQLADIVVPEMTPEQVDDWLAEQVQRFGERLEVRPLAPQDHTRINPVEELLLLDPAAKVIPVIVDGPEDAS